MDTFDKSQIEIFSTTPQSKDFPRETYVQRVIDVAQWSEQADSAAILVYTDNSIVDPWPPSRTSFWQNTKHAVSSRRDPTGLHAPVLRRKDGVELRSSVRPTDVFEHGCWRIQK